MLAFRGHFLPSRYHSASGCRLARLGLIVILQVKVALSPSFPNVTSNVSVKVMLIFVYLISGKMASEKQQNCLFILWPVFKSCQLFTLKLMEAFPLTLVRHPGVRRGLLFLLAPYKSDTTSIYCSDFLKKGIIVHVWVKKHTHLSFANYCKDAWIPENRRKRLTLHNDGGLGGSLSMQVWGYSRVHCSVISCTPTKTSITHSQVSTTSINTRLDRNTVFTHSTN